MIAELDTNTLFVSGLLEKKQPALFASVRSALNDVPIKIIPGTADIWCRDYMPIQLDQDRFCQFVYAPDYLQHHQHLVTPPEKCRLPFMLDYQQEPIVLDGGNVVASRTKVILTEKVYKENPSIERPRLRDRLEEIFQAECIFIPKQAGDDVGHSDGVVRFVVEDRVLINDYATVDPGYGEKVRGYWRRRGWKSKRCRCSRKYADVVVVKSNPPWASTSTTFVWAMSSSSPDTTNQRTKKPSRRLSKLCQKQPYSRCRVGASLKRAGY